ncbi:MAG: hypothetical protein GC159_02605 [Phycisphaera sp.]|nr:hypothetical protein [Phycisphaera sp.]
MQSYRFVALAAFTATALLLAGCAASPNSGSMQRVTEELPTLGHRNWIVVADSAYPWQTAPGIETIYVGGDQLAAVKRVLHDVEAAPHVDPIIYLDAELEHVSDADAPGIAKYRKQLASLLKGRDAQRIPHEQIIAKLGKAGQDFHVLLLKTDLTLPYTSVFIELYAGYWDAEREAKLRAAMEKAK